MRKHIILIISLVCSLGILAQYKIQIHSSDGSLWENSIENLDSIKFNSQNTLFNITGQDPISFNTKLIDSVTFAKKEYSIDTIKIVYNGSSVEITNPYENDSVYITNTDANVIINSAKELPDIIYYLTGTTENGSLTLTSARKYILIMDGVSITSGGQTAAIWSTSGKTATVILKDNTENYLADNSIDTCNASFRSKGQIIFSENGNGTLTIKGNANHAIQSSDYVQIDGGTINVTSAPGDGIHVNDYFLMNAGTLNIEGINGDGVDVGEGYIEINGGYLSIESEVDDIKGLKSAIDTAETLTATSGNIIINNGFIDINVSGAASKAIKSERDLIINGGSINLNISGGILMDDLGDVSYAAGIKSDRRVYLNNNGILKIITTENAEGARGINADSAVIFNNGILSAEIYSSPYITPKGKKKYAIGVKSDGYFEIHGGDINISCPKEDIDGGICISVAEDVKVNGGYLYCNSYSNDAIATDSKIIITDGFVMANGGEGSFRGFDCGQRSFSISGGTVIGTGGQTSYPNSGSQHSIIYTAENIGQMINLKDTSENNILTYQLPLYTNNSTSSVTLLFSSPEIKIESSYLFSKEGTVTGGIETNGYFNTEAIYTGGVTTEITTKSTNYTIVQQ